MILGDFVLNIAASLAYSLLEHVYKTKLTDPEGKALQQVYTSGFAQMLASIRRPLNKEELSTLRDVLTHFVTQTGSADAYLALAIRNDKPDLDKLGQAFRDFDGPAKVRGLDFDFERGLLAFYAGLTEALLEAAGKSDSPLSNLVTVNQNQAILRVLAQVPALPVIPEETQLPVEKAVTPITQTPQYYTCFISYSHKNEAFVERLYMDLQQAGVRCWYAPEDIPIGAKTRQAIYNAIGGYDKLLVILSRQSINSEWVGTEVENAFAEEQKRKAKKRNDWLVLFPIRLDDAVMRTEEAWAAHIRMMRNIGDFSQWQQEAMYQKQLQRLLRDLLKRN